MYLGGDVLLASRSCNRLWLIGSRWCLTLQLINVDQEPHRPVPPWLVAPTTAERDSQAVQIAVGEWYEVKYLNTALYNCPVVSRSFKPQPDGEFCFCKDLEPVPLSLLSYVGNKVSVSQHWQVHTRDVTVFKPEVDICLLDADARADVCCCLDGMENMLHSQGTGSRTCSQETLKCDLVLPCCLQRL